MKKEKIMLTSIEKEKLSCCIALVAKDFELQRLALEKALDQNERGGRLYDNLLDRIEHCLDRQSFYENLKQKLAHAIENNQI